MATPSVVYRRATEADVEAEHAVFCRAEGGVIQAHGYPWTDPPLAAFAPGLRHFISKDGDRCWVAEADGNVAGFTAAFVRDDTWFFAMLFIDPDFQGRGIGRALFELAVGDAPRRRLTITDSIQPVSNALYGRHGLLPITPLLPMSGTGRGDRPADVEAGEPSAADLAAVDHAAYGFDRRVDHAYWVTSTPRRAWYRNGSLLGYAYRDTNGYIGPLAGVDPDAATIALTAELAEAGPVSIEIPASARSLLRTALAAGLHIDPPLGLLLASDDVALPTALTIRNYSFY